VSCQNPEEWRETDEHGEFTIRRYPYWGPSRYEASTSTLHLSLGGISEKTAYHELIHRVQSNTRELERAYQEFKGGLWGVAKNANPAHYYGSPIEQMAHAGADVEWLHYTGSSKSDLHHNRRDKALFQLPQPDPELCAIPESYDHHPYEEAYLCFVSEYIDLLPDD
jgi:hypothetical protein